MFTAHWSAESPFVFVIDGLFVRHPDQHHGLRLLSSSWSLQKVKSQRQGGWSWEEAILYNVT